MYFGKTLKVRLTKNWFALFQELKMWFSGTSKCSRFTRGDLRKNKEIVHVLQVTQTWGIAVKKQNTRLCYRW